MIDFCSYNIRGLHNKASFVKDFLSNNNISFVALLETHVKKDDALFYSAFVAPRFTWMFNYEDHVNGRIWLGWDAAFWSVQLLKSSAQQITCNISRSDGSCSCIITSVYAYNNEVDRRLLWDELVEIQDNFSVSDLLKPWCVLGDFNSFLYPSDINRPLPRRCLHMDEFRNCLNTLGLTDLKFQGSLYTWWDCNINNPVMRKLDRVLVNDAWLSTFDFSMADFLPRGLSDHNPATVSLGISRETIKKPFQLFNHLLENDQFLSVVQSAWNNPIRGDKWYVLTTKLRLVKQALKEMNNSVGNLHVAVNSARNSLLSFQASLPPVPSREQRIDEGRLCINLQNALNAEERLLKQKSRIRWLKQGDGNNSYFFNSCKGRWNSNKLLKIKDDNGVTHLGHKNVATVAVNYYQNLLGSVNDVES